VDFSLADSSRFERWLFYYALPRRTEPAVLKKLLTPFPASKMKSHLVRWAFNHPENDSGEITVLMLK
jgi:hypothetical protein